MINYAFPDVKLLSNLFYLELGWEFHYFFFYIYQILYSYTYTTTCSFCIFRSDNIMASSASARISTSNFMSAFAARSSILRMRHSNTSNSSTEWTAKIFRKKSTSPHLFSGMICNCKKSKQRKTIIWYFNEDRSSLSA